MDGILELVLVDGGKFFLAYTIVLNLIYVLLIAAAASEFARHFRRRSVIGPDELMAHPMTPAVSLIAPAFNEAVTVVESVKSLLALRYPQFELVLVDDGSTDQTFPLLRDAFDLVETDRAVTEVIAVREPAYAVYESRLDVRLVVVRKRNSGRADALNVGINVAQHPLVCFIDADSLLDPHALLDAARPFVEDPERVVGTGGVILPVNGCRVVDGRVVEARVPRNWWVRIQVVEYLRAFVIGRTGWSRLGVLMLISGAFGMYRRDVVVDVGGLDAGCIGEDLELLVRIHRHLRRQKRAYRVAIVAESVAWTEVPPTRAVLGRQRRRWSRGLTEVLWKHRSMFANPRYGAIGMIGLPYYFAFEFLAPFVEIAGALAIVVGCIVGLVDVPFAMLFLLVALGSSLLVAVSSVLLEELSSHRYKRGKDLGGIFVAAILENFGYRQLTACWRLQGVWSTITRREAVWGLMAREGFASTDTRPAATTLVSATLTAPGEPEARQQRRELVRD